MLNRNPYSLALYPWAPALFSSPKKRKKLSSMIPNTGEESSNKAEADGGSVSTVSAAVPRLPTGLEKDGGKAGRRAGVRRGELGTAR